MSNELLPDGRKLAETVDEFLKRPPGPGVDEFLRTGEQRVEKFLQTRSQGDWFAPKQALNVNWLQEKADEFSNLHTLGLLEISLFDPNLNSWEQAEADFRNQYTGDPLILTLRKWGERLYQVEPSNIERRKWFTRKAGGFFQSVTYPFPRPAREQIRRNLAVQFNLFGLFAVSIGFYYYQDHFGGQDPFGPLGDIMQQGGTITRIKDHKLRIFLPNRLNQV